MVPGLVDPDLLPAALEQAKALEPGPYEQAAPSRNVQPAASEDGPAFRPAQFGGTTLFPFARSPHLNALVLQAGVIDFARRALGTDDIRLYQARAWSKYAGQANYEQPLHRDLNHSLVPTRSEPGYWHLECFLYLHDVDESNGAPRVVVPSADLSLPTRPFPVTPADAPEMYAAERPAPGPAGTLLCYRSDVWHRGVDLAPGTERHLLIIAFRPADADWIGFDPMAPLVINRDYLEWAATCTPDQLSVFGVPKPGHHYWTAAMVEAMAIQYPGLDVSPWRDALG